MICVCAFVRGRDKEISNKFGENLIMESFSNQETNAKSQSTIVTKVNFCSSEREINQSANVPLFKAGFIHSD
jgi:hypothetical protein